MLGQTFAGRGLLASTVQNYDGYGFVNSAGINVVNGYIGDSVVVRSDGVDPNA